MRMVLLARAAWPPAPSMQEIPGPARHVVATAPSRTLPCTARDNGGGTAPKRDGSQAPRSAFSAPARPGRLGGRPGPCARQRALPPSLRAHASSTLCTAWATADVTCIRVSGSAKVSGGTGLRLDRPVFDL